MSNWIQAGDLKYTEASKQLECPQPFPRPVNHEWVNIKQQHRFFILMIMSFNSFYFYNLGGGNSRLEGKAGKERQWRKSLMERDN